MKIFKILIALSFFFLSATGAHAQLQEKKILTLEAAEKVAAAAEAEAKKRAATIVIVVVDDGGYPIVLKRLNDTQVASVDVGIGKARTAAIFRRSSKDFEDQIKNGRLASLVLPGATPLQGGVPLISDGKVVGAIGVSGNTPQEDEDIAKAGAASFEASDKTASPPVTYLPAKQVSHAFVKGMPLVRGNNYKSMPVTVMEQASSKFTPATRISFTCSKARRHSSLAEPSLMRDPSKLKKFAAWNPKGGEARTINKGDVVVIPNGTAHWFKEVKGPIDYYVAKVRAAD